MVGMWTRALLMRESELRNKLTGQLNGGKKGWNRDEAGVMQAVCDLAVRWYFGPGYDVRAITEVAPFIREADQAAGKSPHGQLEMEAVIRHSLGETDVDVSGINAQVAYEVQAPSLRSLCGSPSSPNHRSVS